jgi:predicted DsbA family dithiol-disulfide isomerase
MKIDIWSDVRCPFCYIGKHKFETALEQFAHKEAIEVQWHSFELDPDLKTRTDLSVYDHFAERKGIDKVQAGQMLQHAAQAAQEVGLTIRFEDSVIANSFKAHRLIQFAKTKSLGNEIKEALFRAHFEAGKNVDDTEVLLQIGLSVGLEGAATRSVLDSNAFADAVRADEQAANEMGIRGVPFFVFNNQYAVSGAQSPDTFLKILDQSWAAYEKEEHKLKIIEGERCSVNGSCD